MNNLWTLQQLAEHWAVPVEEARRRVRNHRLPFVQYRRPGARSIRWAAVRFDPEAVRLWDEQATRSAAPLSSGACPSPASFEAKA